MPVLAKARLVTIYYLSNQLLLYHFSGWLYRQLHRSLGSVNVSLPAWDWIGDLVTPPMSILTDRLLADIGGDPRGEFVFAHVLPPHYPYMYDANCVPNPKARDRLGAASPNAPPPQTNTEESRRRRYELYEEQVRCVLREFERLLDTLEVLPGFEDAVIIVHGDHGSKITIIRPTYEHLDRLTSRDLRDSYSTLFAVRAPGVPAGVDSTRASIQELLSRLAESDCEWPGPMTASPPFVFLEGEPGGIMRRIPYRPAPHGP
jgi:arylsulfatase A-like enzyme